MRALVCLGDIGGARAILPILIELQSRNVEIVLVDHRLTECPEHKEVNAKILSLERTTSDSHLSDFSFYIFGTSVKDTFGLTLARKLRLEFQLPIYCVLDNWMNYANRLRCDGLELFLPDKYFVMDDYAVEMAVKDGLPKSILFPLGQPALGKLDNFTFNKE